MRRISILFICVLVFAMVFTACKQVPIERVRNATEAQIAAVSKGVVKENFGIEKFYYMEPAAPTDGVFIGANIWGTGMIDTPAVFYLSNMDGSGVIYALDETAQEHTEFPAPDAAAMTSGISMENEDAKNINKFVGGKMYRVQNIVD